MLGKKPISREAFNGIPSSVGSFLNQAVSQSETYECAGRL